MYTRDTTRSGHTTHNSFTRVSRTVSAIELSVLRCSFVGEAARGVDGVVLEDVLRRAGPRRLEQHGGGGGRGRGYLCC